MKNVSCDIARLVYFSSTFEEPSFRGLSDILEVAQTRNAKNDVSGALVYANGFFLQVLEGEASTVTDTFRRIMVDQRHHSVTLVEFTNRVDRKFASWSMKHASFQTEVLASIVGHKRFEPFAYSAEQCLQILVQLSCPHVEVPDFQQLYRVGAAC